MVAQAKACMDANDSLASPRGGRRKAFQSVGLSVGIQQWEIDEHVKTGRVKIRKVCVCSQAANGNWSIGRCRSAVRAAHSVPLRARSPTISFAKLEASPLIVHLGSSIWAQAGFLSLSLSLVVSLLVLAAPLSISHNQSSVLSLSLSRR